MNCPANIIITRPDPAKESNKMRGLWQKKRQIMTHVLPRAIHQCSAEGRSDMTAENTTILQFLFKVSQLVWRWERVFTCYRHGNMQQCDRYGVIPNPLLYNPGKHQPSQNIGHFCGDDANWKEKRHIHSRTKPSQRLHQRHFKTLHRESWVWFERLFPCC